MVKRMTIIKKGFKGCDWSFHIRLVQSSLSVKLNAKHQKVLKAETEVVVNSKQTNMADVIQDVGVFNVKDELVFVDETLYLGGEEVTIEHVELEVAFHNEALFPDKDGT